MSIVATLLLASASASSSMSTPMTVLLSLSAFIGGRRGRWKDALGTHAGGSDGQHRTAAAEVEHALAVNVAKLGLCREEHAGSEMGARGVLLESSLGLSERLQRLQQRLELA